MLVKYTYYGDANLDGKVDGSDYTLIDNAFNNQGAQLTADIAGPAAIATAQIAGGTSVPEPASLSVLALGGVALLGRRRWVGFASR